MMNMPNPKIDSDLILYGNRVCLGEIRPNMRQISIQYIEAINTIQLRIYYDKPLTQEEIDYDVSGTILTEIISDFPQELEYRDEVVMLPYPNRILDNGICIYRRYEPSPDLNE